MLQRENWTFALDFFRGDLRTGSITFEHFTIVGTFSGDDQVVSIGNVRSLQKEWTTDGIRTRRENMSLSEYSRKNLLFLFPDLFNPKNRSFLRSMTIRFHVQHIDVISHFVITIRGENDLLVEHSFDRQILVEFLIDHRVIWNALLDSVNHIHRGRFAIGRRSSMLKILMMMMDECRRETSAVEDCVSWSQMNARILRDIPSFHFLEHLRFHVVTRFTDVDVFVLEFPYVRRRIGDRWSIFEIVFHVENVAETLNLVHRDELHGLSEKDFLSKELLCGRVKGFVWTKKLQAVEIIFVVLLLERFDTDDRRFIAFIDWIDVDEIAEIIGLSFRRGTLLRFRRLKKSISW